MLIFYNIYNKFYHAIKYTFDRSSQKRLLDECSNEWIKS